MLVEQPQQSVRIFVQIALRVILNHKEGEQLEDRRNVGENSCKFGGGTDQRVQSLMFMMMMMIIILNLNLTNY